MQKRRSRNRKHTVRPGQVLGPTGAPLTRDDLPPPDTKRWVMRRKAEVVTGVDAGLITLEEACRRYALSVDEFRSWQRLLRDHGLAGLRATHAKTYRAVKPPGAPRSALRQPAAD